MARVLVIDDEPDVVRLIVKVLSGKGHTVQIARDGASAHARVKHEPPDVILLDSDLPKIDGAEVCRRIKMDETTGDIPIVMMTSSYIDIYDVGAEGGPDSFVVRPFVRDVLANAIERVFRR
jgi:CheY-like chemotaxis protein